MDERLKIVSGLIVWKLHATHGFPLEMSIPALADKGMSVEWRGLFEGAARDGANINRLIERVKAAVEDGYAPELAREILDHQLRLAINSG